MKKAKKLKIILAAVITLSGIMEEQAHLTVFWGLTIQLL
jgi:hypothetical protein